jgi:BTB/POZ domain-containing protein 9
VVFFEAYFKATIPKVIGDIICPITNVATLRKKAMVIEGGNPNELINENFTKYDENTGFTFHIIGKDKIMVQLGRLLPYTIYSFKFDLFNIVVSTTLHGFEYETTTLGWRRKELQIFY